MFSYSMRVPHVYIKIEVSQTTPGPPASPSHGMLIHQDMNKHQLSLSPKLPSSPQSKIFPVNHSEKNDNNRLITKSTTNSKSDSPSRNKEWKSKSNRAQSVLSHNCIDPKQIETIGAQKQKKKNKKISFSPMNSKLFFILLALLFISLLVIAIVVPIVVTSASTTSASTLSTTINWNTTTSTSTTATSTTSTTATTTTSTATTTAATVTITPNICTSSWEGISMVAYCTNCTYNPNYYVFPYNYTAISNKTRIAFSMRRQDGYFAMDAISVRNFLTPNTEILINGGFELGNLSSWTYCSQDNTTNTGGVKANSTHFTYLGVSYYAYEGSYYYIAGSTTATDYISQSFPTVIGNQYAVSFAVVVASNGSLTSGYFFLGI